MLSGESFGLKTLLQPGSRPDEGGEGISESWSQRRKGFENQLIQKSHIQMPTGAWWIE